ncbi:hypothetical protein [Micromonospora sp. URMC 103]|uniref:hypothetical protein n=1 Tax=Micromonospora sp. URMC 103 TaxID=3423406 RepID=UPI003F1AF3DA
MWGSRTLGVAMTAVGVVGAATGAVAAWSASPVAALLITALGVTVALLGIGLLRDLRRPRAATRRRDGAGGLLLYPPTGDAGSNHADWSDRGGRDSGDSSGADAGGGWSGSDSGGWSGGDSGGGGY